MAADRISVHLGETSWPPGRGGTAGQTPAPRGSGWGQCRLGPWCAWPGLPVLPVAADPVEVQEGAAAVLILLQLLPASWSMQVVPVLPGATLLCQHQEHWGLPPAPHLSWHSPALW